MKKISGIYNIQLYIQTVFNERKKAKIGFSKVPYMKEYVIKHELLQHQNMKKKRKETKNIELDFSETTKESMQSRKKCFM